jgi:para-nitrobenzyl esterase
VPAPFTPDQLDLSDAMITYWTNFAKTGNPNSAGQPAWPAYSAAADEFQSFVPPTPATEADFATEHLCTSVWDLL